MGRIRFLNKKSFKKLYTSLDIDNYLKTSTLGAIVLLMAHEGYEILPISIETPARIIFYMISFYLIKESRRDKKDGK